MPEPEDLHEPGDTVPMVRFPVAVTAGSLIVLGGAMYQAADDAPPGTLLVRGRDGRLHAATERTHR